jgi:molybdopterin-guanine dinucleotide biosynthesis protein A
VSCTGVILAGGGATRFGGAPKGLAQVGAMRIVDRVAASLRDASDALLLIANAPDASSWLRGVATHPDVRPGTGALGGLHAALTHASTPILLVAWDMPFVPSSLLRALRARGEAGADAVLPESDGSRRGVEPLCAWYAPSCLPAIEAALDAGERRVVAFHHAVRVERLPLDVVTTFGDPGRIFSNVNTPDDLVAAHAVDGRRE